MPTEDLSIPEFLDRRKNPKLNRTPAELKATIKAEQERHRIQMEKERLVRQISSVQRKLDAILRRGEPDPESIPGKIAAGYRKKLARLTTENNDNERKHPRSIRA